MDLTTKTPAVIDAQLADLYGVLYEREDKLARAWQSVHYAADDRQRSRYGWVMTNKQAREAAQAKASEARESSRPWRAEEIETALEGLAVREAAVEAALDEIQPFQAEYADRPWSRFFVVTGGHIHRSMNCPTCNKGNERTRFGWLPELSGKSMAEAIAHFEEMAKGGSVILCTVCFPDAPVFAAPVDDSTCPGSGTRDYDEKSARRGFAAGNGAECKHCGKWRAVSNRGFGKLIKHKREG